MATENSNQSSSPEKTERPSEPVVPKSPQAGRFVSKLIIALILVLTGAGGTLWVQDLMEGGQPTVTERTKLDNDGNEVLTPEETTVSSVVDKVADSIVSIVTEVETSNPFFGTSLREGAGTGMIVGSDGYVLTNKHVVNGAREVQVVMRDGTIHQDVDVIGVDPLNDLAFLKINGAKDLPKVELGDSTTVRIGQQVIAIGNSLGQYQNTVTSGIISGTGRPVAAQGNNSVEMLTDLLQTDAAINPGNSGGPLLNTSGQVIGVNTAIAADAEGIGFAIPINAAKGLLKQVLDGEKPQRAYLGIRYQPVNAEVAKKYKLSVKEGALVISDAREAAVIKGSPADEAGIRENDVIIKVNDVEVGKRGGLSSLVAEYAPGDTIELTYMRGKQKQTARVTLEAYR